MKIIPLSEIQKQVRVLGVAERYFDSVVLFALHESGVLRALASGPRTLEQLLAEPGGDPESLRATVDAAVALRILTREDGVYQASDDLLDCLGRPGAPAYLGEWVEFLHALATPLMQLPEAIRTGVAPAALFEDTSGDPLPAQRMTRAMDAYARSRGIELADRLDFSETRSLLDLGCGPGTYSLAIIERHPHIRATLLDHTGPIAEARRIAAARGMETRVEFVASDARDYVPERPFDTLLLSNTLHMIGPEGSRALLRRCHDFLSPGGRIIVQAQYLNDDRVGPRWPTLLNLIQRVATPNGRNHALGETRAWMEEAGFVEVVHRRLSAWNVCSCLVGHRPH